MTHAIDLDAVLARIGRQIETGAAERDAEDAFAADGYRLLRDHRVFSALVPAELGGGGTSHGAMCRFIRGLGRRCPSTALALSMHQHLVAAALANHLAGRPGRTLLEAVAGGERILVSTGANDWLDSNGRAEPVEGGWRVTAVKPFASGAPMGNMLVTSAVATPAGRGEDGGGEVLHMAMPLSAAGVTVGDDWQALGMRATGSHTVSLEGVFVPEAAVSLRRPRGAFHPAFAVILTVAMPLILSAYLGAADQALAIARDRVSRHPDDPVAPFLLAEMETAHTTAELAWQALTDLANGLDFTPTAALAASVLTRKAIAAGSVRRTCEKAVEASGGAGYLRRTGLERLLRDSWGAGFHPLPEKRQQLFCGRLAMGLDPVSGEAQAKPRAAA